MLPRHYRRDGTPYSPTRKGLFEWVQDFENKKLCRVALDTLPDGSYVSTVWLGIDHDHWAIAQGLPHQPLIFETMVFDAEGKPLDDCQVRYHTENDAIAGHVEMVDKLVRKSRAKRK